MLLAYPGITYTYCREKITVSVEMWVETGNLGHDLLIIIFYTFTSKSISIKTYNI